MLWAHKPMGTVKAIERWKQSLEMMIIVYTGEERRTQFVCTNSLIGIIVKCKMTWASLLKDNIAKELVNIPMVQIGLGLEMNVFSCQFDDVMLSHCSNQNSGLQNSFLL